IRRDDMITLVTPRGDYHYRVVSTRIVNPRDVAVLDPDGNEILTLVTCYPFYFVGSAPDRFIVRAERITDRNRKNPNDPEIRAHDCGGAEHFLPRDGHCQLRYEN